VHLVALVEQELGEIGAVLAGDAGDLNGLSNIRGLVHIRMNAISDTQGSPTDPEPESASSHQVLAGLCWGKSLLTA
jgi:hypothetical protein